MKNMIIIIVILAIIFTGMVLNRNSTIGTKNNVNIEEIQKIEEYISKIYMWKEVTNEALPVFEDVNNVDEIWLWEVVKKNLEEYQIEYSKIQEIAKKIFGENFNKEFPKEGNLSFEYYQEIEKYIATEISLDEKEDCFLLNDIKKVNNGYIVEIIEYLEDYSEENNIIIRNLKEEEIGRVSIQENEQKVQEIVKNKIERFDKKKITLNNIQDNLVIQKVEKEQE